MTDAITNVTELPAPQPDAAAIDALNADAPPVTPPAKKRVKRDADAPKKERTKKRAPKPDDAELARLDAIATLLTEKDATDDQKRKKMIRRTLRNKYNYYISRQSND